MGWQIRKNTVVAVALFFVLFFILLICVNERTSKSFIVGISIREEVRNKNQRSVHR